MRKVFIAGVGMTRFAKQPERNLKDLAAEAVRNALADARLELKNVEAIYFANAVAGSITGQEMVRGQMTLRPLGVHTTPIINVENACASAASALNLAWLSVASGQYDVVLALGAEKMTHPDKTRTFAAIGQAMDVESLGGVEATSERSPLMDAYAESAREYMRASGATAADFAAVVVKNQHNGALNPLAQYGGEISIEQVLSARVVVEPLTLYMCSPISDGAAAAVVVSQRRRGSRPVQIAASVIGSGVPAGPDWRKGSALAAERAYAVAGLGPRDVDMAELHDAAASAEVQLYEQVGFAAPCEGPGLIRDGAVNIDGRIPVNPSGGLTARGHPIGATGLAQIYEAVLQLREQAGQRQVEGVKVALTQNGGGWLDGDNVAHSIHILVD
ncbi:MAG TPA: thiolase [Chloroflexi bacterium]|nr:thiolase [Chloroflexota bacterium]